MARRKNPPESVLLKSHVSERLRLVRTELFGERGGPELARKLGIPMRTWYNYESGVTVPAEVILRFVEMTAVEPVWLLHGRGPRYRVALGARDTYEPSGSVSQLLRTALRKLEQDEAAHSHGSSNGSNGNLQIEDGEELSDDDAPESIVLIGVDGHKAERLTSKSGPRYLAARREWLAAQRDLRCIRIEGNAMAPIAANGAFVAHAANEEAPQDLDASMVVANYQGIFITRWFQLSGKYALLRAENPEFEPSTLLIDIDSRFASWQIRRVLWIATPH